MAFDVCSTVMADPMATALSYAILQLEENRSVMDAVQDVGLPAVGVGGRALDRNLPNEEVLEHFPA